MKELFFSSAAGGNRKLTIHEPQGKPTAVVQIVHGMAEYYARYYPLAEALNAAGIAAAGHDHLGHGEDTPKERLGYFADQDGWQMLVDDVHTAHLALKERYRDSRHILLGHSMGSFISREYLLQHQGQGIDGLVLSGTGFMPPALVYPALLLAKTVCALGGATKPSEILHKLAFSKNNRPFRPNRTSFDWGSADEEQVDLYVNDPLCGFMFTGRGMYDLFTGLTQLTRVSRLDEVENKKLPILFISGERDPVGGKSAQGPKEVAAQYKKTGFSDVTMQLYPQGRHEMFNEVNRDEVVKNLIAWINRPHPA